MPTTLAPMPDASPARHKLPRSNRLGSHALLAVNAAALLAVAFWLRVYRLDNIPGMNGDEAWSGAQALRLLHGESIGWRTPTGNPINVFFFLPLVALHTVLPPSFALLRCVSLVSGLLALAVNWGLCRRTFGVRTAMISTLLLAVLPIDIAYSRFAWDASQSLLATVLVMYLPVVWFHKQRGPRSLPLAAIAAFVAAVLVHPTNVFAAPLLVVPIVYERRRSVTGVLRQAAVAANPGTFAALVTISGVFAYAAWTAVARAAPVLHGPAEFGAFAVNYLRLFSGATIYEYIAGVQAAGTDAPWGAYLPGACDLLFGSAGLLALWGLQRRLAVAPTKADVCLVVGWFTMLVGFFAIAGPRAIAPHLERYGICLVAPGALVLSRGLDWWLSEAQPYRRAATVALATVVWLWPVTFYLGYFVAIEQTGGRSHDTFRTAAVEPKLAALRYVLDAREAGAPARIVCRDWWNYWPLAYLALGEHDVQVLTWDEWRRAGESNARLAEDHTWFVEYAGQPAEQNLLREADQAGIRLRQQTICDHGGRPLLSVIGGAEKVSQNY